jgi:hypothetical protein
MTLSDSSNFILEERKSYYQGDNFFEDLQREMTHASYFLKDIY